MVLKSVSDGGQSLEAELERRSDRVFAANPDLLDHRTQYPWLTGALGDINARVWFIAEAPSRTQAERAQGESPERQWSVSRGDKLFRKMLVKHGFKSGDETSLGGWNCYITDVVKSLHRAGKWSELPDERRHAIAAAWAPVLAWELETGQPELVVSVGDRTHELLDYLQASELIPALPRRKKIRHYTYVAMRPDRKRRLGPSDPLRIAEYDAMFGALLAGADGQPMASGSGALQRADNPLPPGDSSEQRDAEARIVATLATNLGVKLAPRSLTFNSGVHVELDAASEDLSVLVEAWAHQGSVKSAQRAKVLADAFKLAFIARVLDSPTRLILLMSDEMAAKRFRSGWAAEALETFNIELVVVELDPKVRQRLLDAQVRQYR